jgi:hypothetical protein
MPTKRFALEPGGPERLELSWRPVWKNLQVRLDGNLLGQFGRMEDLQQGREFVLDDGSKLTVRLELQLPMSTPYLHVLHNERPLAGSDMDPRKQFRDSCTGFLFFAAIYVLGGLVSALNLSDFPLTLGLDTSSIVIGALLLLVGFWAMRGASRTALGIALAAGIAESAWFFMARPPAAGQSLLLAVLLRLALVVAPLAAFKELGEAERLPS